MDEMMASVILRYVYVAMPQPEETAMNEHTSMLVGAPHVTHPSLPLPCVTILPLPLLYLTSQFDRLGDPYA